MVYSATAAVWPSFYGEMFPARVWLSAVAISTQIGLAIPGWRRPWRPRSPGPGEDIWLGVSLITAAFCLVNVVAVTTSKETYRVPIENLRQPVEVAA